MSIRVVPTAPLTFKKDREISLYKNSQLNKNISIKLLFTLIAVLLQVLYQNPLFAQKLVQDSLIISFKPLENIMPLQCSIDTIIDQRDESAYVIGIYEKTQYLFVPVDLLICTKQPLSTEISEAFQQLPKENSWLRFKLVIDEFKLAKKSNSMFFPRYQLNVSVQLYKKNDKNNSERIGQLLYESVYRKPFFGDKLKKGFEAVIQKWQYELVDDLSRLGKDTSLQLLKLENFRIKSYSGRQTNLLTGFDVILSPQGQCVDGALCFSHREAKKRFFRSGGYNLRYRTGEDFESIEFGLSTDYLFYRFHQNFVFRGKSQLMFGLNRWKDIETVDHKIYDAFIVDYSLSQSLIYNPLDKRSLILGIGVQENLYYIYSKDFKFQPGLLIHFGVKL